MVQTVLVAHITARLLELRPGLSVIKDGGGGGGGGSGEGDWMEMSAASARAAKLFHAQCARPSPSRVRVRFMGTRPVQC